MINYISYKLLIRHYNSSEPSITMIKKSLLFRTFVTLVLLVLAIKSIHASEVSNVNILDRLNPDLSITETIELSIINNTDTSFSLTLPINAKEIMLNDASADVQNGTLKTVLDCVNCEIRIKYTLKNIITEEGKDLYTFFRTLNVPKNPQALKYVIYLPRGYSVDASVESSLVIPRPTEILTDGESILLVWNEKNPEFPIKYIVKYTGHETSETIIDIFTQDLSHGIIILIVILIFIIGFMVGFFVKKYSAKKYQPKIVLNTLLSPDERKVMDYLRLVKTETVNQKEIGKNLSWSKSKVSAVISNLVYKKLIEKEKIGRHYNVKLLNDLD